MTGLTPFKAYRYPEITETVSAVAVQDMATDFDTVAMASNVSRLAAFKRSGALVYRNATQAINKITYTASLPNTAVYDNGASGPGAAAYWNAGVNPDRLTAPIAGLYLFTFSTGIVFTADPGVTGFAYAIIAKNGSIAIPHGASRRMGRGSVGAQVIYINVSDALVMAAGDYVNFQVYWTGTPAGPLNAIANASMSATLIALV